MPPRSSTPTMTNGGTATADQGVGRRDRSTSRPHHQQEERQRHLNKESILHDDSSIELNTMDRARSTSESRGSLFLPQSNSKLSSSRIRNSFEDSGMFSDMEDGYVTSRENAFTPPDADISPPSPPVLAGKAKSPPTPKMGNNSGITFYNMKQHGLPPRFQKKAIDPLSPNLDYSTTEDGKYGDEGDLIITVEDQRGIKLEPIMQALFGIEFLPYDSRMTDISESPCLSDIQDSYSYDDDEDELEGGRNLQSSSDSIDGEDGGHGTPTHKKKKKGPLRSIRKGFLNRKEKKKSRKMGRKAIVSKNGKDRDIFDNVAENIDRQMGQIDVETNKLVFLKSSLKSVQNETRKVMNETQRCSNRVAKVAKTVSELEYKLDLAMRTLERENSNLQKNVQTIANLDTARDQLESQTQTLECMLQERFGPLQSRPAGADDEIYQDRVYNLDPNLDPPAPRSRIGTGTDISFATADEPNSPITDSQASSLISFGTEDIDLGMPTPERRHLNKVTIDFDDEFDLKTPNKELSSYIRVQDLDLPPNPHSSSLVDDLSLTGQLHGSYPNLVSLDRDDRHVVLTALSKRGLECASDESSRWKPDKNTGKTLSKRDLSENEWQSATEKDLFVWMGNLDTRGYGEKHPAVKARGLINASPADIADLLVDSSKVKVYNKLSLGRTDEHYFQKGIDCTDGEFIGEAKIVRNVTSVPLMRRKMELINVMYARPLNQEVDGHNGYIIVTRSVWERETMAPSENGNADSEEKSDFVRSEMLFGINLIREVNSGSSDCSELTAVTHFLTPGMPTFGIKQFAMKSASNYVRSIQEAFE